MTGSNPVRTTKPQPQLPTHHQKLVLGELLGFGKTLGVFCFATSRMCQRALRLSTRKQDIRRCAQLQHADAQQRWGFAKRRRRKVLLSCFGTPVTAEPGIRGLTMFPNKLFASCCCFRLLSAQHASRRPTEVPAAHTYAAKRPFAAGELRALCAASQSLTPPQPVPKLH